MTRARTAPALLAAGAALLLLGGLALRGEAASPDGPLGAGVVLGTALVFLGWLCAALGWGGAIARALGARAGLLLRAASGSALLSLLAMALAQLGLVGWRRRPLLLALLLLGPVLELLATRAPAPSGDAPAPDKPESPAAPARAERLLTAAIQAGLAALLLLALLQAALPDGHPDPLYYDLLGPRLWAQAGRFYLPPSMPILLQCSAWDELGLWAQSLLGGDGGGGLVEGQLFMQWAHALLGGGGCALAIERLLRPFAPRPLFRWTATLAATSAAAMVWTLPFAKNDWGASLWLLAGAALLLERRRERDALLGGALFGLGLIAKLTTLFTALPLFALALLHGARPLRQRLRDGALALGAALAAMLPTLLRNLAESGNPVFPSMNRLFRSPLLSESWAGYLAGFEGRGLETRPAILGLRAALLLKQSPLVLALPLLPLLWLARRQAPREMPLWLASVAAALLFFFGVGSEASLRLFGPGDLLLCAAAALSLLALVEAAPHASPAPPPWMQLSRALALPLSAAIAALSLAAASAPWRLPLLLPSAPPLAELLQHASPLTHYPPVGGAAKAWLRAHATAADRILSLEDDRLYYLSALNVIAVRDDPELDRAFRALPLRDALAGSGANLLITTTDWRGPLRGQLVRRLAPLLEVRRAALLFESEGAQVIDLRALLAAEP